MTAAWAGTGDGSKLFPFTGSWKASDLVPLLDKGSHLAFDCEIKWGGGITVYDDKLNNIEVAPYGWASWGIGYAITKDEPYAAYQYYYSLYRPEEREDHTFIVTKAEFVGDSFNITGHYSGHYDRGDGTKENPYCGEWEATELGPKLKPGVYLDYYCVIKNGGITVNDSKLNKQVASGSGWKWSPADLIGNPQSGSDYANYGVDNSLKKRRNQSFILTDVSLSANNSTDLVLTGYFNGFYRGIKEADGFYNVFEANQLRDVIQADIHTKVRLVDDIDISGIGKIRDTFSGTITGVNDEVDPATNEKKINFYKLRGKYTKGNYIKSSRLFDKVDGAKFDNIMFANIRVSEDEDDMGIIAKTAVNSDFRNICFDTNSLFNDDDYVGFIAGRATKCSFVNIMMQGCDVTTDGTFAGAIVGKSEECTFTNVACGTMVYVFADGGGSNAKSGGITGHSVKDKFTNCSNLGMVGGNDDYVGGITGYSEGSNIQRCTNAAMIAHCEGDKFSDLQKDREKTLAELGDIDEDDIAGAIAAGTVGTVVTGTGLTIAKILLGQAVKRANDKLWFDFQYYHWGIATEGDVDMIPHLTEFVGAPEVGIFVIAVLVGLTTWYICYEATGDSYLAGITGLAKGGKIDQCSNFGYIYGNHNFIGGIVGDGDGVVINNCLNASQINQERDNHWIDGPYRAGGIIGRGRGNTKITNCLTTNSYHITGISSENDRLDETSGNNFCVGAADHDPKTEYLEMYVNQEMVDRGLVATWLNNGAENRAQGIKPWKQKLKALYIKDWDATPLLNVGDEVSLANITSNSLIYTLDQLIAFRDKVNNGDQYAVACLANDIDMKGIDNWEPIGTYAHPFRGIFDGRGFTINNLKVSKSGSGTQAAGLFGVIDVFADINNVIIGKDSEITTNISGDVHGSAGLVGMYHVDKRRWWGNAFIHNCGSYANVTATKHAAGILGRVIADVNEVHNETSPYIKLYVDSCFNAGTITASNGNSALLCAYTRDHAVVRNCWSTGHLVSTGSGDAFDSSNSNGNKEYFVGYNQTVDIKDCIAAVDLTNVSQKGVTLYSDDVAYTGKLTYMLNGNDNNPANKLRWKQDISKDAAPVSCRIHIGAPGEWVLDNKGVSYSRDISSAQKPYGTLCLPYSIKAQRNIDLFTFKEIVDEDGVISLCFTAADEVPAGTPMLYRAKVNSTYEFDDIMTDYSFSTPKPSPEGNWRFNGTYTTLEYDGETAESIYYVSNQKNSEGNVMGIIRNAKKVTIAPFRAFFFGPNISELTDNSKSVIFSIEDEDGTTTDLKLIGEDLVPVQKNGKVYTIMGTVAPSWYKGIVIKNGKKVIQ